jgi:hypothetical protein
LTTAEKLQKSSSEEVYGGDPVRKGKLSAIIGGYLEEVRRIVEEGQQIGAIDPALDAAMLSVMFLGIVQPAAILWHLSDGGFDVTRHAEKAWRLFSEAIRTKPSRRATSKGVSR